MTRLTETFAALRENKRKAFIPFITAGDPSPSATAKYIFDLAAAGADVIELGLPFTDPLADGPTIQASHSRALQKHVMPKTVFNIVRSVRKKVKVPILLMGSINLIASPGIRPFMEKARSAGVDGLIVPDLPPEEASEYIAEAKKVDLDTIFLAAPTSTPDRLEGIARASTGFVYLVSLTGTTGARRALPSEIIDSIARVRASTSKPICVGFGISSPEQAKQIAQLSDGVIVGSAIVGRIAAKKPIGSFARTLARAVHSA